jgi:hypothetical protein
MDMRRQVNAGTSSWTASLALAQGARICRLVQPILHRREHAENAIFTAFYEAYCHMDTPERFSSWLTKVAMDAVVLWCGNWRRV